MISIITPTRGRPAKLARMYSSIYSTIEDKNSVELLLYIDDDDLPTIEFIEKNKNNFIVPVIPVIGPRVSIGKACNILLSKSSGELIMAGADDIVFRTPNWNAIIEEEFKKIDDSICMFSLNDLYCDPLQLATHPIMGRRALETLGYFLPEVIDCNYGDMWLCYIFMKIERFFPLPDIIVEHMHWLAKKDSKDITYHEGSANMARHSEKAYVEFEWLRDAGVQKLLDIINT